jgi:hypothetical protein
VPNLSSKKSDFISTVIAFSQALLGLAVDADELASYQVDNLFQAASANAIVDADCVGANQHLTAAQVNAVLAVAASFSTAMTASARTTLRKANSKPNG